MQPNDWAELCAFHQRSHYDMIQAQKGSVSGLIWTYAPCDPQAAARAAAMLLRMGERRVRHSRRACLEVGTITVEVVIVTDLPMCRQTILRLVDAWQFAPLPFLQDESLAALAAAFYSESLSPMLSNRAKIIRYFTFG